jgi:hypothetical protein
MRLGLGQRLALGQRCGSPCRCAYGSLEPGVRTAVAAPVAVGGLTIGKLIGASVASGLIVWAITKWLDSP